MRKLTETIEGKERWNGLVSYIELIDLNRQQNPNVALDSAKSILESVAKTILADKNVDCDVNWKLGFLVKKAFSSLSVFSKLQDKDSSNARSIISSFENISRNIGEFRNNHGFFSHGRDLQSEKFDLYLVELVISSSDILASFLVTAHSEDFKDRTRLYYEEHDEFNRYVDDASEEYPIVRGIQLIPSVTLFTDEEGYKEALDAFMTEKINLISRLETSEAFVSTRSIARDLIPLQDYLTDDEVTKLANIGISNQQVYNILGHGYTKNFYTWILTQKKEVISKSTHQNLVEYCKDSLF
jgi:hypothetical protein